jgi:integrase
MKGYREHRVPLSKAAMLALNRIKEPKGLYLFPGPTPDTPLSNMALLMTLGRMDRGHITAHGFRSTFRDWAADQTNFPNEVVEMALAHAVASKTEAAYRRSDLFDKRRRLMDAWAEYCWQRSAGKIVALDSE